MEKPMTLTELQEKRGRLVTQAREALDEIKKNTDEKRAAELEARHDTIMSEFDKVEKAIERERRQEAIERALEETPDPRRPSYGTQARGAQEPEAPTYRQAFHAYLRAQGNEGAMDPTMRSVLHRGHTSIPDAELRAQTTSATAGGYMVPTELAQILVKTMAIWGPMYDPGVTTELITSSGNTITMPTVNDTTVVVVQHTQGTTLTDDGGSDVTFGQKSLEAYAYNTEWLRVSKELVDDAAFNVEQILGELLGERLARRVNTELTTGDGTGDPNGIVTASTLGKTAASATAVTGDELIDLLHSVNAAYRASPRARWMWNDLTLAAVRKLKDGQNNYLWQMGDVRVGEPATLLGYPYSVNAAMPAMTTGLKPIVFGDFGKYFVRKVGAPLIGAIQDKDFWPGFGIAGYIRLDGELADTAAVKHLIQA
jgi:HK97 family phage major capsid protein